MTNIEALVFKELQKRNIYFHFQHCLLGKYVVDFFLPKENLVIQADGEYWHSLPKARERDKQCNEELMSFGYTVVRIKGKAILSDCEESMSKALQNYIIETPKNSIMIYN